MNPFLLLLLACVTVKADSINGYFTFPGSSGSDRVYTSDIIWSLGSVQQLRWSTTLSNYTVLLYQQILSGGTTMGSVLYEKKASDPELGGFDWVVQTLSFDLETSPVFFFWIQCDEIDASNTPTSHYFNITKQVAIASSPSSSSTRSSVSISSVTFGATSPSELTSTRAQEAKDSSSKVALGVGLGIGLPVVLVLGAFVGFKYGKARQSHAHSRAPSYRRFSDFPPPVPPPKYERNVPVHIPPKQTFPVELPSYGELPRELQ